MRQRSASKYNGTIGPSFLCLQVRTFKTHSLEPYAEFYSLGSGGFLAWRLKSKTFYKN